MDAIIQLRLTEDEKQLFERCAEREHLSLSAWLRQAGFQNSLRRSVPGAQALIGPAASGVPDAQPKAKARPAIRPHEPKPVDGGVFLQMPIKVSAHDPDNCRLYGCGLCRAAGITDARRGL